MSEGWGTVLGVVFVIAYMLVLIWCLVAAIHWSYQTRTRWIAGVVAAILIFGIMWGLASAIDRNAIAKPDCVTTEDR